MTKSAKAKVDLAAIGRRIRELRGDQRQIKMALFLGITQGQLSKIERGALPPSVEVLIRVREISGKTIDWMLMGKK